MVVGNDEIDSSAAGALGGGEGSRTCVHADDKANAACCGRFDHVSAQVVAFADAMWNMEVGLATAQFDRSLEDDHSGSAIDVIVAVDENAFFAFDGTRYRLHAWTIMPNHVHVLFTVLPDQPLGFIVGSWKRFTARRANELLGRSGEFWQSEYWDRFIRNEDHFGITGDYIDQNPVKAGLVSEPRLWPYGSARLKA